MKYQLARCDNTSYDFIIITLKWGNQVSPEWNRLLKHIGFQEEFLPVQKSHFIRLHLQGGPSSWWLWSPFDCFYVHLIAQRMRLYIFRMRIIFTAGVRAVSTLTSIQGSSTGGCFFTTPRWTVACLYCGIRLKAVFGNCFCRLIRQVSITSQLWLSYELTIGRAFHCACLPWTREARTA